MIGPVLRALDWPLDDPNWVQVEVGMSSGGKADYVLYDGAGRPVIVLEAKALGSKLDLAGSAAVEYAWELMKAGKAPELVGVSDGLHWVLAEPHNLKAPKAALDLAKSTQRAEMSALALAQLLWRRVWEGNGPPPPGPNGSC